MNRLNLFLCAIVLSLLSIPAQSTSPYGLCTSTETTVFSCQTTKQKLISLCGTLPGTLQYRFGKPDHMELRYPENAVNGTAYFKYAHFMRPQTDRFEINFCNQGVDYTIFDYTEEGKSRAGIRIVTIDGTESEIICSDKIESQLHKLKKHLPCDSENALNMGNCPQ